MWSLSSIKCQHQKCKVALNQGSWENFIQNNIRKIQLKKEEKKQNEEKKWVKREKKQNE